MIAKNSQFARLLHRVGLPGFFLHLQLMLGRRALVVIIVDLLLVTNITVLVLMESDKVGFLPISLPFLLLGVPLLADIVAMERRAGSLDLVLAIPSAGGYFQQRTLALTVLMIIQGTVLLLLDRLFLVTFTLTPALLFLVVLVFFLASAVLFFASILKSPGAITLAVFSVVLLLSPWVFAVPLYAGQTPDGSSVGYGELSFWGSPYAVFFWLKPVAVLAIASVIMYLYAQRRFRQPELLLVP